MEQFCILFPDAEITTLVSDRSKLSNVIQKNKIKNSLLQYCGGVKLYKYFLPLYPFFVQLMKIGRPGDIIINSDASVLKGIRVAKEAKHICYCYSPPRYLWDLQQTYEKYTDGIGSLGRAVFRWCVPYLREYDRRSAQRVTHFIAISRFVQQRIHDFYSRKSDVIYPPVDVDSFDPNRRREDFFLLVSELTPYKRVDLAVDAFRGLNSRLVIIGDGSEGNKLKKTAPDNVTFLGRQPFSVLKEHYETCSAFLYPQIEDFGITALEAQAAGAPVIAFRAGGAMETVVEGETGFFFDEQTADALRNAIKKFEQGKRLSAFNCRKNAEKYKPERFRNEVLEYLKMKIPNFHGEITLKNGQ